MALLAATPEMAVAAESMAGFQYGIQQTLAGLKVIGFIFLALVVVFAFASGSKRPTQVPKKKAGPVGGSHAVEGMILDADAENPLVRHAARRLPLWATDAARIFSDRR
ncbi:MAG: hypothetical protein H7Z12_17655 [Rhodospirillaceae bacterium]|nr:hypothetical protein [Rhodospirillales bacterium]